MRWSRCLQRGGKRKTVMGSRERRFFVVVVVTDQLQVHINLKNDGKEGKGEG